MTKQKEDSVRFALAEVIDIEQARARREEAARRERLEQERLAGLDAAREAEQQRTTRLRAERQAAEQERERQERAEAAALLAERLERERAAEAAAAEERFQRQVADRLARIQAEGEAEIARMRLEFVVRDVVAARRPWLVPTLLVALLALVGSLGIGFGMRLGGEPAVVARSQGVAATTTRVMDRTLHGAGRAQPTQATRKGAPGSVGATGKKQPRVTAPSPRPATKAVGARRPSLTKAGGSPSGRIARAPLPRGCGKLGALACIHD